MPNLTAAYLREKLQTKPEDIRYLKDLCEIVLPFAPNDIQMGIWLRHFDLEICSDAIEVTGEWFNKHHRKLEADVAEGKLSREQATELFKSKEDVLRYAWGCMRNMRDQRAEATNA